MKKLATITVLALLAMSCEKKTPSTEEQPGRCGVTCILTKVGQFSQSSNICDSTATVKQYTFQSQNVYLFDQGTCGNDFTISVLNDNCDTLGYLGGIMGNNQINGQDFYSNATYQYTIWNN